MFALVRRILFRNDSLSCVFDVDRAARRVLCRCDSDDPDAPASGPSELSALVFDACLLGVFDREEVFRVVDLHDLLVARMEALEPGDKLAYVELEVDWLRYKFPEIDEELLKIIRLMIAEGWDHGKDSAIGG